MSLKLTLHPALEQIDAAAGNCIDEQLRRIASSGALATALRAAFYRGVRAAQEHPGLCAPEFSSTGAER